MAYTKTLIGNVTKGANHKRGDKRLQAIVDTVDDNLTNIEMAFGQDTVLGFGTEPPAVENATSGTAGTAATASRSDHSHDLGNLGLVINAAIAKTAPVDADYVGLMDSEATPTANVLKKLSWAYIKSVLKTYFDGTYSASGHAHGGTYQPVFSGATTLTQLGIVPPTAPAWSGTAMAALSGASTFQQLLDAINTDIATAATLPAGE